MHDNNKLELVVEVDVNKANASIGSVNTPSTEQAASKAARGASAGIDGMTASMVRGAAAGIIEIRPLGQEPFDCDDRLGRAWLQ